jgi:hypothetical protein
MTASLVAAIAFVAPFVVVVGMGVIGMGMRNR